MRDIMKCLFLIVLPGFFFMFMSQQYFPVEYIEQSDYRTRQYYPALVIDKIKKDGCNPGECRNLYKLRLERDDKTTLMIVVDKEKYDQAVLGEKMSFERHLTDPVVYQNTNILYMLVLFTLLAIIAFWLPKIMRIFECNSGEKQIGA